MLGLFIYSLVELLHVMKSCYLFEVIKLLLYKRCVEMCRKKVPRKLRINYRMAKLRHAFAGSKTDPT